VLHYPVVAPFYHASVGEVAYVGEVMLALVGAEADTGMSNKDMSKF